MKPGIHPDYHPVVFVDGSADFELISRSTKTSKETREIDGVEHYVIRVEISSASHPFFTGQQRFVDTAGRVERFQRKYEKFYKDQAPASSEDEPQDSSDEASASSQDPADGNAAAD